MLLVGVKVKKNIVIKSDTKDVTQVALFTLNFRLKVLNIIRELLDETREILPKCN